MKLVQWMAPLALTLFSAACSKDAPPAKTPAEEAEPPGEAILDRHPEKAANFSSINVSQGIREKCGLSETEAYFEFDSASVSKQADTILSKIAQCFTTGPLAGAGMNLVGHADPRGDSEYNLVLGGQRADHVVASLAKKGVASSKLASTSRGEMDASGQDERGWAKDRRVDVLLAE